jgi:O-antigen/teichoic acid export membrane protein
MMLKRSISSLLDQVLLSALNFGIAFALIQGISKSEYGLYVQLWLFGLLATSIADALLGNAFNILNNRPVEERPNHLLLNSFRLSLGIAAVAALLGAAFSLWLTQEWASWTDRLGLLCVYVCYLLVLVTREFKRVCFYLTERWQRALIMDAVFACSAVSGLAAFWWAGWLSVTTVFVALTVASGLAFLHAPKFDEDRAPLAIKHITDLAHKTWALSGWALPGTVVGWAINNVYLFLLSEMLGSAATAEANASKLAIMPLALTLVAWYQIFRADIARLAQSGDDVAYKRFVRKSFVWMYVPLLAYLPAFTLVYPWIEPLLTKRGYTHMDTLIMWWFVSAAVAPLKFFGTSLLVGFEAFKPLFKLSVLSLVVQSLGVLLAGNFFGLLYVVPALIVADLLEAALMWGLLLPRAMRAKVVAASQPG